MIRNTYLISEGSPILSGIATGLACQEPPPADLIFCTRSQWLFSKTYLVIACNVPPIRDVDYAGGAIVWVGIVAADALVGFERVMGAEPSTSQ